MATQADVGAFRRAGDDLVTLANAELARFWRSLDLESPQSSARALREFYPALVAAYGEVAAAIAADYYDELRANAAVAGGFAAVLADPAPSEQAQAVASWGLAPMFREDQPNAEASLSRLAQGVQRLTMQPARQTLEASAVSDPIEPRYARVPTGARTCAFCLVLASRGAVYLTRKQAGGGMNRYHGFCDCIPTLVWPGDQLPENYDPDALKQIYLDAGPGSLKQILSEIRQSEGVR